jgi:hypothetical protein
MLLKQSTARSVVVLMIDSSDHLSGKTGLTLTINASKDGAAFSSITPTVTELSYGFYKLALTTSHTDTLGDLALHVTATGADATDKVWQVLADLPGTSPTAAAIADAVWDEATADHTTAGTFGKKTGDAPTATENADALLKRDMSAVTGEAARSPLNALRWLRNRWGISGGTLTVYKENDTDAAWTAATTQTASNPTTASDPA